MTNAPNLPISQIFTGAHGWHYKVDNTVDTGLTRVAPSDIDAAEQRLGVVFPDVLRRLYLVQNGGVIEDIVIPAASALSGHSEETLVYPFVNGALPPVQALTGLVPFWDVAFQAQEYADLFGLLRPPLPDNADQMIVLSDWPGQVLLLDLRAPGRSPVGLCALYYDGRPQEPRWQSDGLWWADAECFFNNLQRVPG